MMCLRGTTQEDMSFFHMCLAENMLGFLVSQSMAAIILRRNDENNEIIYIYYIHISISMEY